MSCVSICQDTEFSFKQQSNQVIKVSSKIINASKLTTTIKDFKGQKEMIFTDKSTIFEEIIRIPWGEENGFPQVFVSTPQTSLITDKVSRQMRAPVNLKVNPWGWIDVLVKNVNRDSKTETWLYRFSNQGNLVSRIKINHAGENQKTWDILDYVVDKFGYIYLLENVNDEKGTQNYLRKLNPEGELVWKRSGSFNHQKLDFQKLEGNFHQLLIDNQSVPYLSATQHQGMILKIDSERGSLNPYADWGKFIGEVFMDGSSNIYYVRYVPETQKRCWFYYNPAVQKEIAIPCNQNLYELLAIPIAVDEQGRGYAVNGMNITRISQGMLSWQEQIDNIILQPEKNAFYISYFNSGDTVNHINIKQWEKEGQLSKEIKLVLPDNLISKRSGTPRLTHVDSEGNYYVYAGETTKENGKLLIYSPEGVMRSYQNPAPDIHLIEYRLQPGRSWAVDLQGNIYLPLLGATGFHLIKMTPR